MLGWRRLETSETPPASPLKALQRVTATISPESLDEVEAPPPPNVTFLTRQDVQEELRRILRETLVQQMQELGTALQREAREAFDRLAVGAEPLPCRGEVPLPRKGLSFPPPPSLSEARAAERPPTSGSTKAWMEAPPSVNSSLTSSHLPGQVEDHDPGRQRSSSIGELPNFGPDPGGAGAAGGGSTMARTTNMSAAASRVGGSSTTAAYEAKLRMMRLKSVDKNLNNESDEFQLRLGRMKAQRQSTKTFRRTGLSVKRYTKAFCKVVVGSDYFDYFMGVLLIVYAFHIGVQVDWMARNSQTNVPVVFRVLDAMFCVAFLIELALRVAAHGREFTRGEGWKWNVFDLVAAFFGVVEELGKLLVVDSTARIVGSLSLLRVLRLSRVLRVARMMRLIPELKSMVYLIMASMGSFLWTVVLIILIMYCTAVYFTELATEILAADSDPTGDVQKFWGSIGDSMLSLYMAISGGDDWRMFVEVFEVDGAYVVNTVVFAFYIAFATLVMLNLVTGVFVEGAQRIIKEDRDHELLRVAAKQFLSHDMAGRDLMSHEELEEQLANHKMDDYCRVVGVNPTDAHKLFYILDDADTGRVSIQDFVKGCLHLKGPAKLLDLLSMAYNLKVLGMETHENLGRLSRDMAAVCEALNVASATTSPRTTQLGSGNLVATAATAGQRPALPRGAGRYLD